MARSAFAAPSRKSSATPDATSAAEALMIVEQTPGLGGDAIYRALLARLELDESALPRDAVIELLWQLENLGLVAAID